MPTLHQTRWGKFMLPDDDVVVSPDIARGKFWEGEVLLPIYDRHINPGDIVVQVGAFVGQDTVFLDKTIKAGKVYAFEPQPKIFELLCANLTLNDCKNVVPVNVACYSKPCKMSERTFSGCHYDTSPASVAFHEDPDGTIAACTLDGFGLDRPVKFMHVDAQGCDLEVLRGAEGIIRKDHPVILFECDMGIFGERIEDFMGFLLDYKIRHLGNVDYLAT